MKPGNLVSEGTLVQKVLNPTGYYILKDEERLRGMIPLSASERGVLFMMEYGGNE